MDYQSSYILLASGESVGLPKDVKGNSEVGHLNLGAGRVIHQNLPRINKAIENGQIYNNETLKLALQHAQRYQSNIHLIGLLSDGNVHSHYSHFQTFVDFFAKANFTNELFIHGFTDGRDTGTNQALSFITEVDKYCIERGIGKIGTLIGRYYAMDRNKQWDKTQRAYFLLTENNGPRYQTYQEGIQINYDNGITDEFMEPMVINDSKIQPNDVVLFMNFRPDRALQLTRSFIDQNFQGFQSPPLNNLFFASMVEYKKDFPDKVIFPKQYINLPIGKVLDSVGLRQLRIAESEKFPHVTYFFNGGMSIIYPKEDRISVPSPNVATFDLQPEMNARKVTDILIQRINSDMYDFILLNLANADMVGHSGNLEAGIKAIQTVDACVHEIVNAFTAKGGAVIITADHGNVEEMLNLETGEIDTEHSLNPVPFIVIGTAETPRVLPYGALKDVAPTILEILGITKPMEMTGSSLLRKI